MTPGNPGDPAMWGWVLAACLVAFALKLIGYLVPARWLASSTALHVAAYVTIGLLAALTTMNTIAEGQAIALDARLAALVVAVIALRLGAPFIAVVLLGAAVAALARALGWG